MKKMPRPLIVEGDKGKLGQVFNNLLANAVKFNKNGGKVAVTIEVRKDTAHIAVSDTGIGIEEGDLDKVFARFYQCDASSTRKYGGTGIGLAIAQDIVRLHGSRITVTSKVGEGATFRFTLPLYIPSDMPGMTADPSVLPIETRLLVAVVSRDKALSAQIRSFLQSEGMDIIHALSAEAALTMIHKHNPDCILVDTEADASDSPRLDTILDSPYDLASSIVMITDDDMLYKQYEGRVVARVKRSFRKSTLLSGIHLALSQGAPKNRQLGRKILCVDDDEEIGIFIARCLENEGYETEYCSTGERALALAASREYWLVLLDVAIQDMDGWAVCRNLKNNSDLAGIKVYIVTAKAVDHETSEIRESEADGYLLKPFKADEIISVVRAFDAQTGYSQYI
jgi:DNA-binding response OmpR family regulator